MTLDISDADLQALASRLLPIFQPQFAPGTLVPAVNALQGWQKKAVSDGSFGRMFNGPQWLDNVAIRDGTITGAKLTANLVISNKFTTVDPDVSPTADRMELDINGLRFYGTVSAVANTKTAEFKANGDFTLGTTNPITYVANTGVLTVPAATIGSLTIAQVGSGILGGTYRTAASGARIEFSTAGILAYNSGGTNTVNVDATNGNMTITGTFTIQSATSSARVEIKNTGLTIYDSGGTARAKLLNDGSGFIGSTSGLSSSAAVSWTTGGTTTINANNITAGTLNAASVTISNINATNINTGSLNGSLLSTGSVADSAVSSLSANKISAGTGIINALTIKNTLTLGAGGKIIDADGSYWDQSGIRLISSGSNGDTISWYNGATFKGGIYATSTQFIIQGTGGAAMAMDSNLWANGRFVPGQAAAYGNSSVYLENYDDFTGPGWVARFQTPQLRLGGSSSYPGIYFEAVRWGGSAGTWTANAPSNAAYVTMQIGSTVIRIPWFTDS